MLTYKKEEYYMYIFILKYIFSSRLWFTKVRRKENSRKTGINWN